VTALTGAVAKKDSLPVVAGRLLDWLIVPFLIFVCLYNPGHTDGLLLHLEAGYYLGAINELIFHKVPFRDFFVLYGPLSVLVPAWLMKFLQPTLEVLRTHFHIGSIFTIIIAYFVARTVLQTRAFSYLAAVVLVKEAFHPFMSSRWGGIRMGIGLLVLFILFRSMRFKKNTGSLALAGFFCGLAVLYSTEIGLAALLASAAFIVSANQGGGASARTSSLHFLYFVGGCVLAIMPFFVYLAWEGALGTYIRTAFWEIPVNYVHAFGQGHVPRPYPESIEMEVVYDWIFGLGLKTWLPLIVYGSCMTYVAFSRELSTSRDLKVYLITLCGFGFPLYLAAFRAVTQPQFGSAVIPAIIIGMLFLESIWFRLRAAWTERNRALGKSWNPTGFMLYAGILAAALCYVACSVAVSGPKQGSLFCLLAPGREEAPGMQELDLSRAGRVRLPRWQATEIRALIGDVVRRTSPDEPIFVFPDMASYYFLAERKSVGRFTVSALAALKPEYRKELRLRLEASPPRYIIYDEGTSSLAEAVRKKDKDMLPEIYEFIWSNYRVVQRYGSTLLLRLDRPSNQAGSSGEPGNRAIFTNPIAPTS